MERDRDDALAEGEETIREGGLVIEERMTRREGLVEYEGTVEGGATAGRTGSGGAPEDAGMLDNAMQGGATMLGGVSATGDEAEGTSGQAATGGEGTMETSTRAVDPLSMSTDSTARGVMTSDTVEGGPISQVREGMTVVDAAGNELGKVDYVKMGDPSAMTTMGEEMDTGGLLGGDDEPDVEDPFRSELIRVGFIKVGGSGLFGRARYAPADQIASVEGDTVRLSIDKNALPS